MMNIDRAVEIEEKIIAEQYENGEIDGKEYFYDLYRLKNYAFLTVDDELIMKSRLDDELCRVRVVRFGEDNPLVELVRDRPASVFWKLHKVDLKEGVYLIER